MSHQTCLNCGTALSGPFCSNCGQKEAHRYSVAHVLHELVHVFTHADKGIFSFAWQLLYKPGIIARDLIDGKRKQYFNLFQYLLLIVGFITFLTLKTNAFDEALKHFKPPTSGPIPEKLAAAQGRTLSLIKQYQNIYQMLSIPIYAFFGWLFTKDRINFAESIVVHTASSAQTNTLGVLTLALAFFVKGSTGAILMTLVSFVIIMFSFALCYRQCFKVSWSRAFLWGGLVIVCSYVVQSLLMGVVMVAMLLVG